MQDSASIKTEQETTVTVNNPPVPEMSYFREEKPTYNRVVAALIENAILKK